MTKLFLARRTRRCFWSSLPDTASQKMQLPSLFSFVTYVDRQGVHKYSIASGRRLSVTRVRVAWNRRCSRLFRLLPRRCFGSRLVHDVAQFLAGLEIRNTL